MSKLSDLLHAYGENLNKGDWEIPIIQQKPKELGGLVALTLVRIKDYFSEFGKKSQPFSVKLIVVNKVLF